MDLLKAEYTMRGTEDPSALVLPVEIKPQTARKEGYGTKMERDVGNKALLGWVGVQGSEREAHRMLRNTFHCT